MPLAGLTAPSSVHLSRDGSHVGPPVVLPRRLLPSMLTLRGDSGPHVILRGDADVAEFEMPPASADIDSPTDIQD